MEDYIQGPELVKRFYSRVNVCDLNSSKGLIGYTFKLANVHCQRCNEEVTTNKDAMNN
jgi:hypothetical protein